MTQEFPRTRDITINVIKNRNLIKEDHIHATIENVAADTMIGEITAVIGMKIEDALVEDLDPGID